MRGQKTVAALHERPPLPRPKRVRGGAEGRERGNCSSWSQCMRKSQRRLSINLVAADVSPLILHWRSLSRLTSAATSRRQFMVPMHARKQMEAFHEPTLRNAAFRLLNQFCSAHCRLKAPFRKNSTRASWTSPQSGWSARQRVPSPRWAGGVSGGNRHLRPCCKSPG